ncbi:hypothetical protein A0J52_02330 [Clostridium sporogenes]|uniref:hypothetical protein n=1 Tax=Clostridium TaxID=1485 RepID=UPI00078006F2|nr:MULTISPECIES: hypothetical protein [Clostridium]KYN78135.1 hypothetical protein A0J52_02330 [Clostridium sporogenes]MBE6058135.1 hypothetical protein [Clostridium sp.]NFM19215.1 hypothetical protein [Clostridium sporogenes]
MKAGTIYSKKQYKLYSKVYLVVGIIFIVLGIFFTIAFPPVGIIILIFGISTFVVSRHFKKSSIEGGHPKEVEEFVSTSEVKGYIKFNDNIKQILISPKFNPRIVNYSDILDFELIENGKTVETKGGLGRTAAGGVLFGGVGAIVGGTTGKKKSISSVSGMKIKIVVNDMSNPNIYINIITTSTKIDSFIYRASCDIAQRILSMLKIATSQN